jgi:hypothetical protein
MARIRSVKPSFFRHEKLQELGPLSMLIFSGLWTQCDKAGRFAWRPRTLKLDILPFITFDMEVELNKLAEAFFIVKYESEGEFFGVIPTFKDHQRVSGKEQQEPSKYPNPPEAKAKRGRKLQGEKPSAAAQEKEKHPGSDGEAPEKHFPGQEGNGVQERSMEGRGSRFTPPSVEQVREYCASRGNSINPKKFVAHYQSKGWKVGKSPMKDWKAAVITWENQDDDRRPSVSSDFSQPDFRGVE